MALKKITTVDAAESVSSSANLYVEDSGAFKRITPAQAKGLLGVDELKSALKLFADDGKVFESFVWEQGLINADTGLDTDDGSTTRCRTAGYYSTDCEEIVVDRSVVPYGVCLYYYDENHNFVSPRSGLYTSSSITPNKNQPYFRIAVYYYEHSTWTISATDCANRIKIKNTAEIVNEINTDILKQVGAEDTKTNLLHNYVNYDYDIYKHRDPNPSAADSTSFGYDRNGTVVTLNGTAVVTSVMKLNGIPLTEKATGSHSAWKATVPLLEGHVYDFTARQLSGTEVLVGISIYIEEKPNTIGSAHVDSDGVYHRIVVGEGDSVRVCLYINAGSVFVDSKYLILMSDITDETDISEYINKSASLINDGEQPINVEWEQGLIDGTTGEDSNDNLLARCRTKGYISTNCKIHIDRSVTAYSTYLYYYGDDYTFEKRSGGTYESDIIPDKTYPYFRVAITPGASNIPVFLNDCERDFTFIKPINAFEKEKGTKILPVGNLVNGHLTANGTIDDDYTDYRLSTNEVIAFPFGMSREITVHINGGYLFAIRYGATRQLSTNDFWYKDGDIITIPAGMNYYGVSICKGAANTSSYQKHKIFPSDDVGLVLTYQDDYDVTKRNEEAEKIIGSARLFFSSSELNTLDKYAVIGHTSDCHGDYKRVDNFLSFCDAEGIDAACVTGDIVAYAPGNGIAWFHRLLNSHNVLPAVCIGNHDVNDSSMTDTDIYNFFFADIATKVGNATGKTWYYTDIASKKLRIISVNLYQYGGSNRWYTHFTSEQLTWFVSTLQTTPADYGVIVLTHAPQTGLTSAKDVNYPDFYQNTRLYNNTHNSVSGGVPLYDIIDAFIGGSTLSKTYTQTGDPASITVEADFTALNSGVEFIAHLTGHFHQDTICYVPGTAEKQLMLNVTCTISLYGGTAYPYLADISDQGRNACDSTQDAFNIYVIDRDNKTVKVIRVGSNLTYDMKERKYMVIPYSD